MLPLFSALVRFDMASAEPVSHSTDAADDDLVVTYCLTERLSDHEVQAAVTELSDEERARHDRFMFARDRRDFAVAHAMLRRALSAHGNLAPHEWTFVTGAHGKPALMSGDGPAPLSFNLAHTRGLVACIVGRDADVGIDVEPLDRRTDGLEVASRFFSRTEADALERCDADERQARFIETWTLKEAYVKAIGEGLSCPLASFSFAYDRPGSLRFDAEPQVPVGSWRFELFAPTDRHRLAIAIRAESVHGRRVTVAADGDRAGALASHRPIRASSPRPV
jgi:4'-phosphopantetheinyl transferase